MACRYRVIDRGRLIELSGAGDDSQLKSLHREWTDESMQAGRNNYEPAWNEAVAVGSFEFVEMIRHKPGLSPSSRSTDQSGDIHLLREPEPPYMHDLQGKNMHLSDKNTICFDESLVISNS